MADADEEVPVGPADRSSEWSIEWWGLLPLLAIVVVAIIGWRMIDGGEDGRLAEVASTTTEPAPVATTSPAATSTTTTAPATTTTTTTPAPIVEITGAMKPCRFGDNCLVASFTIEGFDDPPDTFTCIYPNSRRDFTLRDGGKDDACITADEGDTITIEVDGVASKTISEANLEGE